MTSHWILLTFFFSLAMIKSMRLPGLKTSFFYLQYMYGTGTANQLSGQWSDWMVLTIPSSLDREESKVGKPTLRNVLQQFWTWSQSKSQSCSVLHRPSGLTLQIQRTGQFMWKVFIPRVAFADTLNFLQGKKWWEFATGSLLVVFSSFCMQDLFDDTSLLPKQCNY